MLKRVISFLLCLNILVSLLPVRSFATEDVTESTEQIVTTELPEETTAPSEAVTEPIEEVTMPTEAVTEPTEEIIIPTEFAVEVTEPEVTTESESVCTGFADCPVSDHDDGCEKKAADEKAAADLAAADSVAALINVLPSLEDIQAKPVEEQSDDYNQVQAAYDAYEQLTNDQKTLLPPSEEVFKTYFDYFNSLTQETATHSHPLCGSSCSCDSSSHSSETWTVWDGTHRMYSNYGYYYLEEDIVLDSTMILDYSYTTYLCLNGHTITCEDRVFDIYSYRSLLITDCKGTGKIETTGNDCAIGNNKYLSIWGGTILNSGTYGPAIETYNGTTTYVCKGTVESENYAAIDSAPGSKVHIQGGTVAGEHEAITSWGNNSGNVGQLTVSGGTVSGNINWICGNYTMTGGYVTGGVDVDSYECEGSTTISGGIIDGALWNCNEKLTITGGQMELVTSGGNGTISAGIFNGNCQIGGNDMIISAGNFSDCDTLNVTAPTWIYGGIFKNIKVNDNLLCLSGLPSIETLEISKPNTVSAQNRDNSGSYGGDPIQISLVGTWSDGNVVIKNVTSDAVAQKFTLEDQDAAWKYLERSGNNLVLRVLPGGECGTSATWRLQNGVLTISGTDAITYNHSGSSYPWGNYVDEITRIVVEPGITGIPSYTFEYCENAATIILPDTLTSLALNAFNDCGSLNHLMLPASLTTISGTSNTGNPAFIRCESLTDVYYLGTEREWNAVANSNQVESHNSDMTLHFLVRHDGTATCTQAGTETYYQFDDTSVYGSMYNADKEPITQLLTVPALGHRVILEEPMLLAPLTVDNTDAVPFALTGDTYYSNNHAHSSSSQLKITAKAACKLTLRYGVSSETNYDKLYIHHNGTQKDMISGSVTEKTMMLTLAAGDVITVRYSKDSSVSSNEDRGWIKLAYDIGGSGIEGEVPAELVEPDCTNGVVCDYCGTVVKAALGHQEVADAAVPPTCTEDGLSAGSHCSVCDTVIVAQEVVLASHTVVDGMCTECKVFGTCGDNVTWELDAEGTLTISGTGAMEDYEFGDRAPWYKDYRYQIKIITFEGSITHVGAYAFSGLSELHTVNIPCTASSIGVNAFQGTNENKDVFIADFSAWCNIDSRAYISGNYYLNGNLLTDFTIPEDVTALPDGVFEGCTSLTKVTIPESVISVGRSAFAGCKNLTEAIISDGVLCIASGMFANCSSLVTVRIADSVTSIGGGAFAFCTSLTNFSIPEGVTYIGDTAFAGCQNLSAIVIPGSVSIIDVEAFGACTNLNEIIFEGDAPEFRSTPELELENNAFLDVAATVYYPINNPTWTSDVMQDYGGTITWIPYYNNVAEGTTGSASWKLREDGMLIISGGAMADYIASAYQPWGNYRDQIISIRIDDDVTHIGKYAFADCAAVKHVTIGKSVTQIGIYAFAGCKAVEIIDYNAANASPYDGYAGSYPSGTKVFYQCGAESSGITLNIGVAVASIGARMFQCSGMKLAEVNFLEGSICTSLGSFAFGGNTFLTNMTIPASVTHMGNGVFSGCGRLTLLFQEVLPDYVADDWSGVAAVCVNPRKQAISEDGFSYWVTQSDTVVIGKYLGDAKQVTVPAQIDGRPVENVSVGLFYNNDTITDVTLPEGLIDIPEYAFYDCDNLNGISIPEGVTTIGIYAFSSCDRLNSIAFSTGVTTIGNNAFSYCAALNEIIFRCSVPAFGVDVFYKVVATTYYPDDDTTWTADVMQDYGGTLTWTPYRDIENRLILDSEALGGYDSVWIDGVEMIIQKDDDSWYVDLPHGNARVMTTYTYKSDGAAVDGVDTHSVYPVSMCVWTLENQNGVYSATQQNAFDDILQYSGISIRITGKQGIRMITSIEKDKKNALISDGLAGYTLKEYGTAVAWASQLSDTMPLTLGNSYVKSNYAYKKGVADPVFAYAGDQMQYTNVLVNFSLDQCKNDMAMRPYMILADAQGNEITIYGGIVERSIGYIALRNRFRYPNYSDYYDYVWGIIHHVYGDTYDADWNPEWSDAIM